MISRILKALLIYNLVNTSECNFGSTFQKTIDCYGQTGCALDLPSSVETGVKTKSWCAMICKDQMNCTSFNYLENNRTCQLFGFLPFLPFKIMSYPECCNYYIPSRIVLPTIGNLALKRETCQSSTGEIPITKLSSWLAVDGLFGTSIWKAECAQTKDPDGGENWFMVDLRQTVGVSLTSSGSWIEVNCSTNLAQPVRYVIVQQTPLNSSNGGYLSLCEVQVF